MNVNIDWMPHRSEKQRVCTSYVTAFIFIVNPHELWLGSFLHSHEMDYNVAIASSVCFKEEIYKILFHFMWQVILIWFSVQLYMSDT